MTAAKRYLRVGLAALLLVLLPNESLAERVVLKSAGKIGVGGREWMSFVAFSPDGKLVASDGPQSPNDNSLNLTLWTFPRGKFVRKVNAQPYALSRDWTYYASDRTVGRLGDGAAIYSTGGDSYANFAFSPDNRFAVAAPSRGVKGSAIRIVSLPQGTETAEFGTARTSSLAVSPDRETLAAGYWDSIALWDIAAHKRLAMLRGAGRYVVALSFSPDGKMLVAGTDDGQLLIWDVRRHRLLHRLQIGGLDVSKPAFTPNGRLVAVGSYGMGEVFLVDARRGKLLDREKVSDIGCGSVAFSPDGRYLITPSTGGLITWPYDEGGTIRVFRVVVR